MTQFIDIRFPTDISLGAIGGPEFLTTLVEMPNGQEQRMTQRPRPRARYRIDYAMKTPPQIEQIRSLYYVAQGRALGFRFQDPLDHQVKDQLIGRGDGSNKTFHLVKAYQIGTAIYERRITRPVDDTVEIKVNGVLIDGFKIGPMGKVVLNKSHDEGALITASFQFDVPVRFDNDHFAPRHVAHNAVSVEHLDLIELIEG